MDSTIIQSDISQKILTLRGEQVILDRDFALLYGVTTKRLNEQVKRNIERFPEDFMFQLSEKEKNELVAKCDRLEPLKHSTTMPYAFTEQDPSTSSGIDYTIGLSSNEAIDCSRSRGIEV